MNCNCLRLFCAAFACLAFATNTNAEIIFSNNFEDNNLDPEVGSWTFGSVSEMMVVDTAVPGDATLGNKVGLIDQNATASTPLDLTLNLTSVASLAPGNSVTIDFDVAARRTNGNTKTIFVDALDSNGDIVTRFVLGDSNAFGNGGGDRQRPGHDPTSAGAANTGNSTFGSPPGSFWWGSDASDATFDVIRDAHMSLTIFESSFDFSTTRASGASFSTTGITNRDGGTYADIASIEFSSAGGSYGIYLDNLVVATAVPEPGSFAILGLSALALLYRRRRHNNLQCLSTSICGS